MQPAMMVLLMCGTLLASGEFHHRYQTEVQLNALAKLPSHRLLADSSDFLFGGTTSISFIFCPPAGS